MTALPLKVDDVDARESHAVSIRIDLPPDVVDEIVACVTERVIAALVDRDQTGPWLYGAKAAAEYLGWPLGRVEKLAAANAIPCHRVGRRITFRREELDKWLSDADRGRR